MKTKVRNILLFQMIFLHSCTLTVNLSKSKELRAWLIIRSVTRFSEHQKLYLK
jgi:hypothetical protein